ncbi:hypothetical protein M409DRAFT_55092 [Zasmidium cellare ATCC 36951]|uniref:Uncharacterized protein n=1 Tax=Zasmidium cellare ATCC 36951 TaxID=1080233 RepID=A0A6A6CKJ0_ZASCE|nr:uncharacterized protein M409DRAFT_55092 [Zasmidium cellare ATCC 36951]KAF2166229.1 hypothetical protein M409DRAFT_55092 [Zasmidium cellare ATCC 36951]
MGIFSGAKHAPTGSYTATEGQENKFNTPTQCSTWWTRATSRLTFNSARASMFPCSRVVHREYVGDTVGDLDVGAGIATQQVEAKVYIAWEGSSTGYSPPSDQHLFFRARTSCAVFFGKDQQQSAQDCPD